jgi:TP901 family phage tail tape measure protein
MISTRTGATGKELDSLTLKFIELGKTQGESVATIAPLVTRMFGDWSIGSGQTEHALDFLRVVSQQTGVTVSQLASTIVYAGAPLRALGYDFDHAATLIGKFEKEGVNTELVLGGMKAILGKFAKDGISDTAAAWQDFIQQVKTGAVGLSDIAQTAGEFGVGRRAAVDLFRAVQEGVSISTPPRNRFRH